MPSKRGLGLAGMVSGQGEDTLRPAAIPKALFTNYEAEQLFLHKAIAMTTSVRGIICKAMHTDFDFYQRRRINLGVDNFGAVRITLAGSTLRLAS